MDKTETVINLPLTMDLRTYHERKEYKNKKSKEDALILSDRYIVKCIKRHSNLKSKEIRENKNLIELYRLRLKLKREIYIGNYS